MLQLERRAAATLIPEEARALNPGFGFLYYGLARTLRPRHVVVIGSGYGSSVVCLARALKDNGIGTVSSVDPSCDDPNALCEYVARFGVADVVRHYRETSVEFFAAYEARRMPDIDLAFIDGGDAFDEVRHDFLAVLDRTRRNSYVLLHGTNNLVRELGHAGVKRWMKLIAHEEGAFEMVDFPFSSGVALVRILCEAGWRTDGE